MGNYMLGGGCSRLNGVVSFAIVFVLSDGTHGSALTEKIVSFSDLISSDSFDSLIIPIFKISFSAFYYNV